MVFFKSETTWKLHRLARPLWIRNYKIPFFLDGSEWYFVFWQENEVFLRISCPYQSTNDDRSSNSSTSDILKVTSRLLYEKFRQTEEGGAPSAYHRSCHRMSASKVTPRTFDSEKSDETNELRIVLPTFTTNLIFKHCNSLQLSWRLRSPWTMTFWTNLPCNRPSHNKNDGPTDMATINRRVILFLATPDSEALQFLFPSVPLSCSSPSTLPFASSSPSASAPIGVPGVNVHWMVLPASWFHDFGMTVVPWQTPTGRTGVASMASSKINRRTLESQTAPAISVFLVKFSSAHEQGGLKAPI